VGVPAHRAGASNLVRAWRLNCLNTALQQVLGLRHGEAIPWGAVSTGESVFESLATQSTDKGVVNNTTYHDTAFAFGHDGSTGICVIYRPSFWTLISLLHATGSSIESKSCGTGRPPAACTELCWGRSWKGSDSLAGRINHDHAQTKRPLEVSQPW
jgi:hypothetical protein